jgi:hypothetical protein
LSSEKGSSSDLLSSELTSDVPCSKLEDARTILGLIGNMMDWTTRGIRETCQIGLKLSLSLPENKWPERLAWKCSVGLGVACSMRIQQREVRWRMFQEKS